MSPERPDLWSRCGRACVIAGTASPMLRRPPIWLFGPGSGRVSPFSKAWTRGLLSAGLLFAGVLVGCGAAGLPPKRLQAVRKALAAARDAGAYHCAPRELALAQANIEFAETEAVQGDVDQGEFHLQEAELNARAARQLSLAAGCDKRRASHRSGGEHVAAVDRDRDGVPERVDVCPEQPEDEDGYLDQDGCLDQALANEQDPCRDATGAVLGQGDGAACPDIRDANEGELPDAICTSSAVAEPVAACADGRYRGIELRDNAVVLADGVAFDGRTTTLEGSSQLRLQALARWLLERPFVTLEIQGHVDSRGDAKENNALSLARAEVVRAVLLEHSVAESRLTTRGYGETRPLESNRTSQGRALNRRIEFVRTDTAN